uniref:KH domain-containing protein n=2 Tax=Caenorhabditis japonica TaxID=281687 RepID=A0A8R1DN37_CAEJA
MNVGPPTNRPTGSYLDELLRELQTMTNIYETNQNVKFRNAQNLLLREIQRIWEVEMSLTTLTSSQITSAAASSSSGIELSMIGRLLRDDSPPSGDRVRDLLSPMTVKSMKTEKFRKMESGEADEKIEKSDKIYFPPESPRNTNPIGRLIGPRGMTIRQLEKELDCKLNIRGKGCTKDEKKEVRMRGRAGWEHLDEPIHVFFVVRADSEEACDEKLDTVKSRLHDFLENNDSGLKRAQLMQLAVIEGTLK